jgi:hypothetical protein
LRRHPHSTTSQRRSVAAPYLLLPSVIVATAPPRQPLTPNSMPPPPPPTSPPLPLHSTTVVEALHHCRCCVAGPARPRASRGTRSPHGGTRPAKGFPFSLLGASLCLSVYGRRVHRVDGVYATLVYAVINDIRAQTGRLSWNNLTNHLCVAVTQNRQLSPHLIFFSAKSNYRTI